MPEDYRDTLLRMLTATTLEATAEYGLCALDALLHPDAAALLIWDAELDRYIIGETRVQNPQEAPQFRRLALEAALEAYHEDPKAARCLPSRLYYQPLLTPDSRHIGAYLYWLPDAASADPTGQPGYEQWVRASTRSLWMMTRIEQADREHAQLHEDRERLQQLLYAVEQQQQTIDRLLTLERQFSASLEAQVAERTAALRAAQARIIHSEKLAVIGQLAASLAHEINNPLQAIQSGLGVVIADLDSPHTSTARDDLCVIQAEVERIQSIFRQMLDFNRPATTTREPLDLSAICEGVRVLLRKRLQEAHISLHLHLAPELPLTCGDSNQIKQVLLNLLLNGAEAIPETGGIIQVGTHAAADTVFVTVHDSGAGIHPDDQQHLFEPFFTTKTRGLGLGLAISQDIIEQHGGTITVDSAPGCGTTFTLALPVKETCYET